MKEGRTAALLDCVATPIQGLGKPGFIMRAEAIKWLLCAAIWKDWGGPCASMWQEVLWKSINSLIILCEAAASNVTERTSWAVQCRMFSLKGSERTPINPILKIHWHNTTHSGMTQKPCLWWTYHRHLHHRKKMVHRHLDAVWMPVHPHQLIGQRAGHHVEGASQRVPNPNVPLMPGKWN